MNTQMDKRFSSQTICKILLAVKIVSAANLQGHWEK